MTMMKQPFGHRMWIATLREMDEVPLADDPPGGMFNVEQFLKVQIVRLEQRRQYFGPILDLVGSRVHGQPQIFESQPGRNLDPLAIHRCNIVARALLPPPFDSGGMSLRIASGRNK